jgi:signal transduction histidine kinase
MDISDILKAVWDTTTDPMWVCKIEENDFVMMAVNPAEMKIDERLRVGMKFSDICKDRKSNLLDGYYRCLETKEIVSFEQNPLIDGEERLFHTTLIPIKNIDGNIGHIFGVTSDISYKLQLQRYLEKEVQKQTYELLELNKNLENRIDMEVQRIINLEQEKSIQENILIHQSRIAEIGMMVGAIAHQWKQPLNAIGIYTQALYEDMSREDNDKYINKILKQIDFMSKTVDSFRNFFKPNDNMDNFDIKYELENFSQLFKAIFEKLNIKIKINNNIQEIYINGNPNEFIQIILNIINNSKDACKYRDIRDGIVTIDIYNNFNETVIINIEDNCGGIDETLLPDKIFLPFNSTKGEDGTGIGMPLVLKIINKMNGTIQASNSSIGAKFLIELPILQEPLEILNFF